jgi:spore coat protein U-like protein
VTVVSGAALVGHEITISVPSMQGDSNKTVSLTLSTNSGLTIGTSASHLSFQYSGSTLKGISVAKQIVVSVDATTRYTVPIVIAVLIALAAVVYVRRKVSTVAKP